MKLESFISGNLKYFTAYYTDYTANYTDKKCSRH